MHKLDHILTYRVIHKVRDNFDVYLDLGVSPCHSARSSAANTELGRHWKYQIKVNKMLPLT